MPDLSGRRTRLGRALSLEPLGNPTQESCSSLTTKTASQLIDANRVATGQRTLKQAKQVCASTGFAEAKTWHFLGSAAGQRLLAIAFAFDLIGAPIGKCSSSTSLSKEKADGSSPPVGSNSIPPFPFISPRPGRGPRQRKEMLRKGKRPNWLWSAGACGIQERTPTHEPAGPTSLNNVGDSYRGRHPATNHEVGPRRFGRDRSLVVEESEATSLLHASTRADPTNRPYRVHERGRLRF